MFQLSISAACTYVRRVLDELTSVEDIGMLVSPDALDLQKLVEGSIVEAAVKTHNLAPAVMLDGVKAVEGTDFESETDEEGVVTVSFLKKAARFISIQVEGSSVVVTDLIPEDSAEGRKQLNRYVRGVPDDPRLVLCKTWAGDHLPKMRYYTSDVKETEPEISMEYYPYPFVKGGMADMVPEGGFPEVDVMTVDEPTVNPGTVSGYIDICPRMEFAVLNELAAMVLESLNEHDKASLYRAKSKEYMGV